MSALKVLASEELHHAKNWPQTPRVLSACLRRLAQALRRAGIEADFGKKSGRRQIRLCKRGNPASFASTASENSSGEDVRDVQDANLQPLHDASPVLDEKLVEELI